MGEVEQSTRSTNRSFKKLVAAGKDPAEIYRAICSQRVELVFTAHPTQARPAPPLPPRLRQRRRAPPGAHALQPLGRRAQRAGRACQAWPVFTAAGPGAALQGPASLWSSTAGARTAQPSAPPSPPGLWGCGCAGQALDGRGRRRARAERAARRRAQALRQSLLKKYARIRHDMDKLHNSRMSPYEKIEALESIRCQIQGAWRTDEIRRQKPTPQVPPPGLGPPAAASTACGDAARSRAPGAPTRSAARSPRRRCRPAGARPPPGGASGRKKRKFNSQVQHATINHGLACSAGGCPQASELVCPVTRLRVPGARSADRRVYNYCSAAHDTHADTNGTMDQKRPLMCAHAQSCIGRRALTQASPMQSVEPGPRCAR